ncbi:2-phosphosulfolactate phosphatase [Phormidium sp. CLA17]|nr:2-phosphosulfolactate phosphatase [Leptolyngbya sp. Cla-17]
MIYNQSEFDLRCEWGEQGVAQLFASSDVVVIVDVLSFSTCVEIATHNGATVFPYRWRDQSAAAYAKAMKAVLAGGRDSSNVSEAFCKTPCGDRTSPYSLSPASLRQISAGTRLVLPSSNGATLSLSTQKTPTLAGCLRNYGAIAQAAQRFGCKIAVIPAGERWQDGSLRPAWEDWVGAGAILSQLKGSCSPEAEAAIALFHQAKDYIKTRIKQCSSGKELIARGFVNDVALASDLNVSDCIPQLMDGAYINKGN